MADRRTKIILGLDAGPYVRGLATASTATKSFVRNLETTDSRMGNLVQTSLALGPALVPIGAAAVPAVAALTAGLGAAAGAAAVAALAFNGVGEGLDALNKYQLEPSVKNLEAVRQAFQDLGPAGTDFVLFLDKLEPKLDRLQNTARAGLLPGVEEGIRSLMDRAPQVNRIIGEISGALGDLAAEGGENLASGRFDDFFNYIENEARPILMDMGRTLGNVAEGLSNMLIEFDPLSDGFSNGLLKMSRQFAKWSRGLEDNRGFQEFVDYVQRVGPGAVETVGALVVALADIVEAAAPVGEATLPIIKAVARALSAIAESPAGPVLVAAAAGLSALSRAVALYNVANGAAIAGLLGKFAKAKIAAASVGTLGLALTDLDEKLGVSNTAMGAAIGTLGGPWGIAIGAAIGSTRDMAAANDRLVAAMEAVDRTAGDPRGIKAHRQALEQLRHEVSQARNFGADEFADRDVLGFIDSFSDAVGNKLTGSTDEAADKLKEAEQNFRGFKDAVRTFGPDANPALRRIGTSLKELGEQRFNIPLWAAASVAVAKYRKQAESVPGRIRSVRRAVASLEDPTISAATSADKLESALEALVKPELDARRAALDWRDGLRALEDQLRKTNGNIRAGTEAGDATLRLYYDQIELATQRISIAKREGRSASEIRELYKRQRDQLLNLGEAYGISRGRIDRMLKDLGLVPGLMNKSRKETRDFGDTLLGLPGKVAPIVKADGAKEAEDATKDFMRSLLGLPPKKEPKVNAPGAKEAKKQVDDVFRALGFLPPKKEVPTSAPGAKQAKREIDDVTDAIRKMFGKTVGIDLSSNAKNIVTEVADAINIFNADGNVLEFYANGDVRNGHVAQIAPAGAMRVWAEPETGGEAYIPLAASKRTRSRAIADETVSRLGGQTIWNADGNVLVRADVGRSKVRERHPQRIDDLYVEFARSLGEKLSKEMNKVIESLSVGMHWPLPRQYSYSGTWGHYSGGGSHPALDFPAPTGTPIFAVLPGRVMHTTSLGDSYGNYTEISHGKGLSSLYAHQQRFETSAGARVMSGETIGRVNNTGNSFGSHLHLEMQRNGVSFDYTKALNRGASFGLGGQFDGKVGKSAGAAQAYARARMSKYGWKGPQWPALVELWNRESGWNYQADNPSSSAYGIPQGLVELHNLRPPYYGVALGNDNYRGGDPKTQIDWGMNYINSRHGSPIQALQFHNANNSYGDGGINLFDSGGLWRSGTIGMNASGRDELVIGPDLTQLLRGLNKLLREDRGRSRNRNLLQPINTGRPNRRRFRIPDLEQRAEREVNRAERRVKRADRELERLNKAVDRAEKRLKDADGKREKAEARLALRHAEDRADDANKRADRAERDLQQAKEDKRTARQDQRTLDRAFKRFDIKPGMDRSETRAEISELMRAVRETLGKDSRLFKALDRFRDRLQSAAKRLDEEREERRKLNDELKETRQAQRDFARTVAGNFKNDPFTGGLDEFYLQVRADRNDAERFNRLRGRGNRLGLDGPLMKAILASGNVELLAELVRGGRGEIRKAENAYEKSRKEANQLGDRAGRNVFGDEVRHLNRTIRQQNRLINKLERRVDKMGDRVQEGAERGSRKGTRDGNKYRNKLLQQIHVETRG